jgi:hypothetical protein
MMVLFKSHELITKFLSELTFKPKDLISNDFFSKATKQSKSDSKCSDNSNLNTLSSEKTPLGSNRTETLPPGK